MGIGTHDALAGAAASPAPASSLPAGVNLAGFLEGELGLGEVARKLERALTHAGVPFVPISYRRLPTRQLPSVHAPLSDRPAYDTNLICLNADYLPAFLEDAGVDFFAGRYSIGVWFWESNRFRSRDLEGLRVVDEVWVASEYVRRAIAAGTDVPVRVVPLPIEAPAPPGKARAELGLPDGFMFLFVFDFVSAQRKNPLAVVEAFTRAFEPGEGPMLVMKGMNGRERKPQLLEELRAAAGGRPDIHVIDAFFPTLERDSLIAACDCYVSLHRSEGFGLTIAEAMAYGKPVIATGYSGSLEFTTTENSYLVPYLLTPVPADWWAYSPGAEWAEPDVAAAAELMRRVHDDPGEARSRALRARDAVLDAFSVDLTAAFVTERLEDIARSSPARGARASIVEAAHALGKGVGASLLDSRRPRRLVRRALARALWPYLEEQHRTSSAMLDALTALERNVVDLSRRLAELEGSSDDERPEL